MRKYPPDVSVAETCIDAKLKMAERMDQDNFPHFQPQEWCAWTIPEIALKEHLDLGPTTDRQVLKSTYFTCPCLKS